MGDRALECPAIPHEETIMATRSAGRRAAIGGGALLAAAPLLGAGEVQAQRGTDPIRIGC